MGTLVLLRHGQSQWNLENRFTGWTDVPLTERGEKDAVSCGKVLTDLTFNRGFVSMLKRAQDTLAIVLKEIHQENLPIEKDAALNERHYGDLQGLNKAETVTKYGEEQVKLWRRSFDVRPPNGESIEDCEKRVIPYFEKNILPALVAGETVVIAAHGNSLRPLFKRFDGLTPEETATIEINFCTPYMYYFEGDQVVRKEVRDVPGLVATGTAKITAEVQP